MSQTTPIFFGSFRLEPGEARLWRGEEEVSLRPKALEMLTYLAQQPGRLVTKDELLKAESGEAMWEAELYRLRGELTLEQINQKSKRKCQMSKVKKIQGEAEACFQQALEVARRQEAKSLELRAAVSLSRLWQQQGKSEEARQLLTDVYDWFTEGFETVDLREARTLLEEFG